MFLMRTGHFPSMRHAELNSLKEPCTFKCKCAINAEKFICNLLTGPLIKMIFEGWRTVLKVTGARDLIWLKVVSLDRSWLVGLTEDL